MSYYRILGLDSEPFSTSPDPAFFYGAKDHKAVLYRLLVALRLKRGLSLILGDVGTGKTTLSRRLYQVAAQNTDYDLHVILNPFFRTEEEFLGKLFDLFHLDAPPEGFSMGQKLDLIEKNLFERTKEKGRTVVLIVDEAQKLEPTSLEVLRVFLNYETNDQKLLQVVLLSQLEILPKIVNMHNLWDRISLKYMLNPLDFDEMKQMIEFRLQQAGYRGKKPIFPDDVLELIHQYTQGYPRKTTAFCHDILERLVMENKEAGSRQLVQTMIAEEDRILRAAEEAHSISF